MKSTEPLVTAILNQILTNDPSTPHPADIGTPYYTLTSRLLSTPARKELDPSHATYTYKGTFHTRITQALATNDTHLLHPVTPSASDTLLKKAIETLWKDTAATHNYYEWTYTHDDIDPLKSNKYTYHTIPKPQHQHPHGWTSEQACTMFIQQGTLPI